MDFSILYVCRSSTKTHRLCLVIRAIEGLGAPYVFDSSLVPGVGLITPKQGLCCPQPVLEDLTIKGYASAFLIHLLVTLWDVVNILQTQANEPPKVEVGEPKVHLERHGKNLCRYVDWLSDDRNGAMMINPCLFFIDAAWQSYAKLAEKGARELVRVIPWFQAMSRKFESRGHLPLRDAWKSY